MYAIILASGNSRRFGGNKLLSDFRGRPLFTYALERALELRYEMDLEIIVVTQYAQIETYVSDLNLDYGYNQEYADERSRKSYSHIATSYSESSGALIRLIHNSCPDVGISASIKLGTQAVLELENKKSETSGSGGCFSMMFMVADQPYLTAESVKKLAESHSSFLKQESPDTQGYSAEIRTLISILCYGDTPGNPVIFTDDFAEDLLSLEGDTGGKSIIKRCLASGTDFMLNRVSAFEEKELFDIDTREGLQE